MKRFFLSLLDLIYKQKCYCCGSSAENCKICSKCYDALETCPPSPGKFVAGVNVYCAGRYNKNLQKMIRGLKYHKQKDMAVYIAKFMYEYWRDLGINGNFTIVPVPLHPKRLKKRKYNQMELVADEFSKLSGYHVNTKLIRRVKETQPQYKLSRIERLENLNKAFEVDKNEYTGGGILILDDISTTGSTFEVMVNELKFNGINNIVCFAAATPF